MSGILERWCRYKRSKVDDMSDEEKVKRYCEDRPRSWARSQAQVDGVLFLLNGLYVDRPEVLWAARLQATLGSEGVDVDEITTMFSVQVGNLLRQMHTLSVVAAEESGTTVQTSRIANASGDAKNILLACEITDVRQKLVTAGRTGTQPDLRKLENLLPLFEGASSGLIDLAEQIIEIERF